MDRSIAASLCLILLVTWPGRLAWTSILYLLSRFMRCELFLNNHLRTWIENNFFCSLFSLEPKLFLPLLRLIICCSFLSTKDFAQIKELLQNLYQKKGSEWKSYNSYSAFVKGSYEIHLFDIISYQSGDVLYTINETSRQRQVLHDWVYSWILLFFFNFSQKGFNNYIEHQNQCQSDFQF